MAGSAPSSSEDPYVAVVCRLCQTRMHATRDQIGKSLICPDCHTVNVVRAPPPKRAPTPVNLDDDSLYTLREPEVVERPQQLARQLLEEARQQLEAQHTAEGTSTIAEDDGSESDWRYPFRSDTRLFFAMSWPALVVAIGLFYVLVVFGREVNLNTVVLPLILPPCVIVGFGILLWLSTAWLSIARGTACGVDRFEWRLEIHPMDWFPDFLKMVGAAMISAAPGWVIATALAPSLPVGRLWGAAATMLIGFPIVLLSMLEQDSCLLPYEAKVWASLLGHSRAWKRFFWRVTGLACGVIPVLAGLYKWPLLVGPLGIGVLAAAIMIYFRSLGRLSWACGESESTGIGVAPGGGVPPPSRT